MTLSFRPRVTSMFFPLMIKFIKSTPLTVIFRKIKCLTIDTSNNNLSDMLKMCIRDRATAAEIDQEVMEMLKKAYDEAKRLLTEHREALDKIEIGRASCRERV